MTNLKPRDTANDEETKVNVNVKDKTKTPSKKNTPIKEKQPKMKKGDVDFRLFSCRLTEEQIKNLIKAPIEPTESQIKRAHFILEQSTLSLTKGQLRVLDSKKKLTKNSIKLLCELLEDDVLHVNEDPEILIGMRSILCSRSTSD